MNRPPPMIIYLSRGVQHSGCERFFRTREPHFPPSLRTEIHCRRPRVASGSTGSIDSAKLKADQESASGEPERVYVCHCRACQRRTGAVVHSGCAYPKSQVRIEGDNKIYERDADSGFKIRFHFCPNCGSTTSWHWLPERAGSNV